MTMKLLAMIFAVLPASAAWAQNGTWSSKADMTVGGVARANSYHATVGLDGYIYVDGGRSQTAGVWSVAHAMLRYDPVTDAWSSMASIIGGGSFWCGSGHCGYDGAVYRFGGGYSTALLWGAQSWKYEVASNTWTQLTDLPSDRQFGSAVVVDDRIWFLGGWSNDAGIYGRTEVFILDPSGASGMGSWTDGPPLPAQDAAGHGLRSFGIGYIDGTVIVAGGYAVTSSASNRTYLYDTRNPGAGWVAGATAPGTFAAGASAVAGEKLYLMGGLANRTAVYEYDPAGDTWETRQALPAGRFHCSAATATVNGTEKIYLPGGLESVIMATTLEFTPPVRPRVLGLRQAVPGGQDLPEGSWVGAMVEFAAVVVDGSGAPLTLEGQVTLDGHSFSQGQTLSVVVNDGDEGVAVVGPFPQGTYRWRCRAVNSSGVSGRWTEFGTTAVDFHVDVTPPPAPTCVAPGTRVRVFARHGGPVQFSWTPVVDDRIDPVRYEIQVDTMISIVNAAPVFADLPPTTIQLKPNMDDSWYFWRVRAIDAVGNPGPWSVPWTFQVYFDDGIAHAEGDAARVCGFSAPIGGNAWGIIGLLLLFRRRR